MTLADAIWLFLVGWLVIVILRELKRGSASCFWNGHDAWPSARWVQGEAPERRLNNELWMFRICKRCRKIVEAKDTGKRWDDPVPDSVRRGSALHALTGHSTAVLTRAERRLRTRP